MTTLMRAEQSSYNRDDCSIGVVHLGYGAFHRAHQAVYLDDYMAQSGDLRWGIAAVNLRAEDRAAFQRSSQLREGYLLKTTSPEGQEKFRVLKPHIAFSDWSALPEEAERLVAKKSVHIITITVTESGYFLGPDGTLDLNAPILKEELEAGQGRQGRSVYAYLSKALQLRAQSLNAPISILCCDNLRANGQMLEANLHAYLKISGQDALSDWIGRNVSFPCSMVDRITPRTTQALRDEVSARFPNNIFDPVHSESFIQWVLENNFAAPFPDLSKVGVDVVENVHSYEEAKIRILNGGHTGICYLGALCGHTTFDESMRSAKTRAHFDDLEGDNILPGLTLKLPFDKVSYCQKIADRFSNRAIADSLERICMDGYAKFPLFIQPTLRGCLGQGIAPHHAYKSIASWYVFARGIASGALAMTYIDKNWSALEPLLASHNTRTFACSPQLWGELPQVYPDFTPDLLTAIQDMEAIWLT